MKLNRLVLSALVSSALLSGGVMADDTGTITFTGSVSGTTCNVDINGAGASASIPLAPATASQLTTLGDTTVPTQFSLELSGCSDTAVSTRAFFMSGPNVTADKRLSNTAVGGAQNVTFQLLEADETTAIPIGDNTQNAQGLRTIAADGTVTLPYVVRYYAEGLATAGAMTSEVEYYISYP